VLQMMKFWAQILLWHLQFVLVIVYWVFYHGTFYKVNTGHHIRILNLLCFQLVNVYYCINIWYSYCSVSNTTDEIKYRKVHLVYSIIIGIFDIYCDSYINVKTNLSCGFFFKNPSSRFLASSDNVRGNRTDCNKISSNKTSWSRL